MQILAFAILCDILVTLNITLWKLIMYTSKNLSAKSLEAKVDLQERRKLQEIARGFRHSQILLTCVELGVFDLLAQRDATAHEISELSGTDPRGMELLLNA